MEALGQEQASLENSDRQLDEVLIVSDAVTQAMRDQRERLKSARRRVLDVMTGLGLSHSLVRAIERRATVDKILLFGGMIVCLFALFLLARWLR